MSGSSPSEHAETFRAFKADPLFAFGRAHGLGDGKPLLLLAPALASVVLLLNAIQGTLRHPAEPDVWRLDFEKIVLRRTYESDAYGGLDLSTEFPLFRDYPSLLLILLISWWLVILYRQWLYMEEYLPTLLQSECLEPTDQIEFDAIVRWGDDQLERLKRQTPIHMIAAFLLTSFIFFAQTRAGIFGILAPTDAPGQWTEQAYQNWWAGTDAHPVAAILYFAVVLLAMYYMIKQNLVGVVVVRGLYRIDRVSKSHIDVTNADGYYGWGVFRKNMLQVFKSMMVVGFSLLILLAVVSVEQLVWLSTFAVIFFVVSPVFLLVPPILLRRKLLRDKNNRLEELVGSSGAPAAKRRSAKHEPTAEELHNAKVIAALRDAPTLPFRTPGTLVAVAAYLVQLAIAILAWLDIA